LSLSNNLALDFQKVIALFATHHILQIKNIPTTKSSTNPIIVGIISPQKASEVLSFIVMLVVIFGFLSQRSFSESLFGSIAISFIVFQL
jgi:hypothetical protein